MPTNKCEKTNNFASKGRVTDTGDIKAPPGHKQESEDVGADYVPPADVKANEDGEIMLASKRRKSNETDSEAYVPIKSRGRTKTKKATETQRELFESHKDSEVPKVKAKGEPSTHEKVEQGEGKTIEGDAEGNVVAAEPSELRGGRRKDFFVNKYGQGHTLG